MKRIVVCVICYNQETVISRSIDSLLCQKEWGLYRIIVSDDCSKDRTWEVLQIYKKKYPDILEIHRNEHNLGIYGNVAQLNTYLPSDYDLVYDLSGDDSICNGYFESLQCFIKENKIDVSQAIGIYSDWKSISPDGEEKITSQNAVLSCPNLWSLKVREKVCNRSLIVSKVVRDRYEPVLKGKGLSLTETHYDSQPHLNIKKAYYLPVVASVYYIGIGVSTNLSNTKKSDYYTTQSAETWNYCLEYLAKSEYDKQYLMYKILKAKYYNKPTLKTFILMLFHYSKGQLPSCKETIKHDVSLICHYLRLLFVH